MDEKVSLLKSALNDLLRVWAFSNYDNEFIVGYLHDYKKLNINQVKEEIEEAVEEIEEEIVNIDEKNI